MPSHAPSKNVDLAVINARIWSGCDASPWAEALAVRGDRLVAVGTNEQLKPLVRRARRVIDARQNSVVPGFIDCHVHFLDGGFRLSSVKLRDADSREKFAHRIAEFAAESPEGTWIRGGDWDHELWGGALPDRAWIDAVTPRHPVWVHRLDGHMALANSLALEMAGLDDSSHSPPGGEIERDADGRPTGVLKDKAMDLVSRVVTPYSPEEEDQALASAMRYVASQGVTSVHHMGTWQDLAVFQRNHRASRLGTRIYAAVPLVTWQRLREEVRSRGRGDEWLRIGNLKAFVDGSLGSRTAAFLEPYTDAPEQRGLFVISEQELLDGVLGGDACGLQSTVHAIGDHAVRTLLDVYAEVRRRNGMRDRRLRMEHAQHVHPDDLDRFAQLEVIASMQPYHVIDDGRWAERLVGRRRAQLTYPIASLIERSTRVVFGSDWFVAPPTPLEGLYAATTRRTLDGAHPKGWIPEQRIGLELALAAYTREAAYSSFEEQRKGTLEVGKLADFVVLDHDLFSTPLEDLRAVGVASTAVGGKVVFDSAA